MHRIIPDEIGFEEVRRPFFSWYPPYRIPVVMANVTGLQMFIHDTQQKTMRHQFNRRIRETLSPSGTTPRLTVLPPNTSQLPILPPEPGRVYEAGAVWAVFRGRGVGSK
jgi:hypothetical protein